MTTEIITENPKLSLSLSLFPYECARSIADKGGELVSTLLLMLVYRSISFETPATPLAAIGFFAFCSWKYFPDIEKAKQITKENNKAYMDIVNQLQTIEKKYISTTKDKSDFSNRETQLVKLISNIDKHVGECLDLPPKSDQLMKKLSERVNLLKKKLNESLDEEVLNAEQLYWTKRSLEEIASPSSPDAILSKVALS